MIFFFSEEVDKNKKPWASNRLTIQVLSVAKALDTSV